MNQPPDSSPITEKHLLSLLERHWPWLALALIFLVLLDFLTPILMPFLVGAALAYLGDPFVDRMENFKLPRTLGVVVVFVAFFGVMALMGLLLVPLLIKQATVTIHQIPIWIDWLQRVGLPHLGIHLPSSLRMDIHSLGTTMSKNLGKAGGIAVTVADFLGQSTPRILSIVAELILIPVVTFYLLRDWDRLVEQARELIPPRWRTTVDSFSRESDEVLSSFIRGQLLVMLALGAIYSVGLSIVGLHSAIAIGIGAGLISFVPYLGFVVGILAATIAMLVQAPDLTPVFWVWLVFGIGQIMESTVLTPNLVGDRVGLHPVAVIFALLAGGQLFGFVGILLALPVAAVLMVLLKRAHAQWVISPLYSGNAKKHSDTE